MFPAETESSQYLAYSFISFSAKTIYILTTSDIIVSVNRRRFLGAMVGVVGGGTIGGLQLNLKDRGTVNDNPLVIGHRGARGVEPDNTIQGIETAYEQGADGVEIDIQHTADGALILHHDPFIRLGKAEIRRPQNVSYSQIRGRDADKYRKVPTLREALSRIKQFSDKSFKVFIELKSDIGEPVDKILSEYNMNNRTTVMTFQQARLGKIQTAKRGFLTKVPSATRGAEVANENNCSFLSGYMMPTVQDRFVKIGHENALDIGLWSLYDTRMRLEWAYKTGADVLIVNRPKMMKNVIRTTKRND